MLAWFLLTWKKPMMECLEKCYGRLWKGKDFTWLHLSFVQDMNGMTMLECMIFFPFPDLMVFTDIVVDVQVIKLMNSALSPVTCGFSFLGILVQEVDLHLEVKDEVVLIVHLCVMLIWMWMVLYTMYWGRYSICCFICSLRILGHIGWDQSTISIRKKSNKFGF